MNIISEPIKEKSFAFQLLILGMIYFISTILFTVIGQLCTLLFFPDLMDNSLSALKEGNLQTINYYKMMQLITSVAIFVVPPLVFAFLYNKRVVNFFGFSYSLKFKLLCAIIILMPVSVPLINATQILNQSLHFPEFLSGWEKSFRMQDEAYTVFQNAFLLDTSIGSLVFNIIMMAIVPAIGEELLFRGLIQKMLIKNIKRIHLSVFITAFLFSAIHFQIFSFLPRFLMGMCFGYVFYWSGNIVYPMIAHFVNNGSAVIVMFLVNSGRIASDPTVQDVNSLNITSILISVCLIAIILFMFKNNHTKEVNTI